MQLIAIFLSITLLFQQDERKERTLQSMPESQPTKSPGTLGISTKTTSVLKNFAAAKPHPLVIHNLIQCFLSLVFFFSNSSDDDDLYPLTVSGISYKLNCANKWLPAGGQLPTKNHIDLTAKDIEILRSQRINLKMPICYFSRLPRSLRERSSSCSRIGFEIRSRALHSQNSRSEKSR